jgi:Fe-S-cluster containining protein
MVAGGGAEADLALLCQSCGLCCDGSLFGRVDLEPDEIEPARKHRLRIVGSGKAFEQPCAALAKSGEGTGERRCSIYGERPRACRRFTCRLYDRQRREAHEGGALEARLQVVRRVHSLLAWLAASGLTRADFERAASSSEQASGGGAGGGGVSDALQAYLELTRTLEEDFARGAR